MPAKKKNPLVEDELDVEPTHEGDTEEIPPGMHLVEEEEPEEIEVLEEAILTDNKIVKLPLLVDETEEDEEDAEEEDEEIDENDDLKALDILERRLRREEIEPARDTDSDEDLMTV